MLLKPYGLKIVTVKRKKSLCLGDTLRMIYFIQKVWYYDVHICFCSLCILSLHHVEAREHFLVNLLDFS